MKMVNLTIDNKPVNVPEGTTILEAAETAGIKIPTLCFHKRLNPIGSCRMCVVDIDGCSEPMASCTTPVENGISVTTDSDRLFKIRQDSLKLILVNHPLLTVRSVIKAANVSFRILSMNLVSKRSPIKQMAYFEIPIMPHRLSDTGRSDVSCVSDV